MTMQDKKYSSKGLWTWGIFFLLATSVSGQCFGENNDAPDTGTTMDGKSLSPGSTKFGLALLKNVLGFNNGAEDNVFLSPISVWSALALTYLGARGQTKAEMEQGLGTISTNQKQVSDLYQDLKGQLLHNATERANYTFHTANRIYFDENVQLRSCMQDVLQTDVEKLNFKTALEPSRQTINRWVEDQTNRKIKELIPKDYLDPERTVMVLVNAAYLKGYWSNQFNERATTKKDFFVSPDLTTTVDMMDQQDEFLYVNHSQLGLSAVELPYSGDEVSMVILLPERGTEVEDLVPKLTPENLRSVYETLKPATVQVSLPKFVNEQEMELKDIINAMGFKDLFDEFRADLSGFTGQKDLFVGGVRHKTFIEVDEGGTEAAAATAVVGIVPVSIQLPQPKVERFIVDRPFVLLIRNKLTDTMLFIGLIRSPKK